MGKYDFSFSEGSSYSRAAELVRSYLGKLDSKDIFLDLACGYGSIAEHVRDELGLTYVGVDSDEEALRSIESRGFRAHSLNISGSAETITSSIESLPLEGRIGAISILDGIEHLANFREALKAIGILARKHNCPVVLSIPNVAHFDLGIKLAAGLWDYTETGLLDDTHVRFFTERNLREELKNAGLEVIEQNNVQLELSDQHFPIDHPFLSPHSSIHKLFKYLRSNDSSALVNQFVWLCVTGAARGADENSKPAIQFESRPSISVVIRTQGHRLGQLEEALLCLAAQSFQDFEVLIVGHSLNPDQQIAVEQMLESLPFPFLTKIRFDLVQGGSRAVPLNHSLKVAAGKYFTFLDDDDLVFSNWLQVFYELSLKGAGKILRSQAAVQHYSIADNNPRISKAESAMDTPYNKEFSLVEHLFENQSPFMTLAFPRGLHDHLGMSFDESLSSTEDWDFLLRASCIVGVENSETVTAVYRKWANLETSSAIKSREWLSNQAMILGRLNLNPVLLPEGEVLQIFSVIHKRLAEDRAQIREQHDSLSRLISTIESKSWRFTRPARRVINFIKRRPEFLLTSIDLNDAASIERSIALIEGSVWWRITKRLRRI